MKKINLAISVLALALFLGSCVIEQKAMVTGNPVGDKKVVLKTHSLKSDQDVSLETACKKGNISKVATVDYKTSVFILQFRKLIVTGE